MVISILIFNIIFIIIIIAVLVRIIAILTCVRLRKLILLGEKKLSSADVANGLERRDEDGKLEGLRPAVGGTIRLRVNIGDNPRITRKQIVIIKRIAAVRSVVVAGQFYHRINPIAAGARRRS